MSPTVREPRSRRRLVIRGSLRRPRRSSLGFVFIARGRLLDALRQPQFSQMRLTVFIDQNVGRLEIAVKHTLGVGVVDGVRDRGQEPGDALLEVADDTVAAEPAGTGRQARCGDLGRQAEQAHRAVAEHGIGAQGHATDRALLLFHRSAVHRRRISQSSDCS